MRDKFCAIVMGDIVSSSKHEDKKRLHQIFNIVIEKSNLNFKHEIMSPLTITLGDEFQGIVKSFEYAFDIIYFIRLNLLDAEVDARFVLGKSIITTEINQKNAWNMMGEGLSEAREVLNNKRDVNAYRFSFPDGPDIEILINAIGLNLTLIEEGWTKTQREYVLFLQNSPSLTKEQVSEKLKISKGNLYKVLKAAKYSLYCDQLLAIKTYLQQTDRRNRNVL